MSAWMLKAFRKEATLSASWKYILSESVLVGIIAGIAAIFGGIAWGVGVLVAFSVLILSQRTKSGSKHFIALVAALVIATIINSFGGMLMTKIKEEEKPAVSVNTTVENSDTLAVTLTLITGKTPKPNYTVILKRDSEFVAWFEYRDVTSSDLKDGKETVRFPLSEIGPGVTATGYSLEVFDEQNQFYSDYSLGSSRLPPVFPVTASLASKVKIAGDWPTANHDMKRSGKSINVGPEKPSIGGKTYKFSNSVSGRPFAGPDGAIYISGYYLFAVDPEVGRVKWEFKHNSGQLTMGSDGTVYFGSEGIVFAVNPDGRLKWQFSTVGWASEFAPAIAVDGTIFVAAADFSKGTQPSHLYALAPDGSLKWEFTVNGQIRSSPALDDAGIIYFGTYEASNKSKIYALGPGGSVKWTYQYNAIDLAVAQDGSIYASGGTLIALSPEGSIKWECRGMGLSNRDGLSVDNDGTAYMSSQDGKIYAISPNGQIRWNYDFKNISNNSPILSSPAIDGKGTVYVVAFNFDRNNKVENNFLYALNPDGSQKWKLDISMQYQIAIGSKGNIFTESGQVISSTK